MPEDRELASLQECQSLQGSSEPLEFCVPSSWQLTISFPSSSSLTAQVLFGVARCRVMGPPAFTKLNTVSRASRLHWDLALPCIVHPRKHGLDWNVHQRLMCSRCGPQIGVLLRGGANFRKRCLVGGGMPLEVCPWGSILRPWPLLISISLSLPYPPHPRLLPSCH